MLTRSLSIIFLLAIVCLPAVSRAEGITVPAGTEITVNMVDGINSDYTGAGERFRAKIDDPVVVGNLVAIPRGADATVQVVTVEHAGTLKGSEAISVKLYNVIIKGRSYDVASDYAKVSGPSKGDKTAKRTAGLGIAGALLGAVAGGGKGAAIGATIGASGGLAYSAAKGTKLQIPPESRLTFVLRAPLPLK